MSIDYKKTALDIFIGCGGEENIINVSHCATRLRLTLSNSSVDLEYLKSINGVMGLVERDNELQFVIGTHIAKLYREFKQLANFNNVEIQSSQSRNIGKIIIDFISGTFISILPILVAAGLISALLTICTNFFGMNSSSGTYKILQTINTAGFYFLPIFLGFSAANKLKINPYMGAYIGAILISFSININTETDFVGISVPQISYAQSIIPIILGVLFMRVIDPFLDKIPKEILYFAKPFLSILIVTPITLIILGPIGSWLAQGMATVLNIISNYLGTFSLAFVGAITPFLVLTGTNQALFPAVLSAMNEFNYDPFILPAMLAANVSIGSAALAVWIKSKNQEIKATGLSTGLTALLGITEPALFGILLRVKRPFFAAVIGGGCGGAFAGFMGLKQFAVASPGFATLPTFISPDGSSYNLLVAIGTIVIAVVVSFVSVFLLKFDDE